MSERVRACINCGHYIVSDAVHEWVHKRTGKAQCPLTRARPYPDKVEGE